MPLSSIPNIATRTILTQILSVFLVKALGVVTAAGAANHTVKCAFLTAKLAKTRFGYDR